MGKSLTEIFEPKFFDVCDKIDEILEEANQEIENEMHQEKCENCAKTSPYNSSKFYLRCEWQGVLVLKEQTNCDGFKKR